MPPRMPPPASHIEKRILDSEVIEKSVAGFLDDLGARIIVFVNAVPESHQAGRRILVLDLLHEGFDILTILVDHRQLFEDGLIGSPMA